MTDRPASLRGARILLGITGGVAAYKAPELVRALGKEGAVVSVLMTKHATRFATPDALHAVTRGLVLTDLFEPAALTDGPWFPDTPKSPLAYAHIGMAREADLVLIAPATANLLAKLAHGLADDLLSTALVATRAPIVIAPAMNTAMWEHPAVQANVATLKGRGVHFVGPEAGELADGENGMGRMAMLELIVSACVAVRGGKVRAGGMDAAGARAGAAAAAKAPLRGRTIVVTAGGTEEAIDPVRVITNRSSGKMGFAIAEEARALGARVTLVTARTTAPAPAGIEIVEGMTVAAMRDAVLEAMKSADALVMAAAVSDFAPVKTAKSKLPRKAGGLTLELAATPDILSDVRKRFPKKVLVGFALETENATDNLARGREKLKRKGLDLIAVNNPLRKGSEFGSDRNDVTLLAAKGAAVPFGLRPKREIAREILLRVAAALNGKR
ncbi:MAG TPA: bifunctional phosphopantothenoylcysteine decarboxylase/phosphopantothenate--cysteine ligase CoaBC [Candidatus Eisenbacteria bacterium]|nr:bifunctional phosphopantothenoylcysteine decarboxylase/phosphopantothenate--cysteine ligase CoaBC [Candidatus Eisenbacteria bacterium]